jgi:16S rRNA (cytosine1402-N4)-methyltransferase
LSSEHVPVLCEETIELVIPQRSEDDTRSGASASGPHVYVDTTFGRGGHTRELLKRLGADDRVVAIDRDLSAVEAGPERIGGDARVSLHHARFSELETLLDAEGVREVAGVIMDLGVSSPQLDDPSRGFSFRTEGPIDMRMDQTRGETAGAWLNRADEAEIADVIRRLGEERHARRIARAIVRHRPLATTKELADVVRRSIPGRPSARTDPATRTFQAIRMHVNKELDEIAAGIVAAFSRLAIHGRLAVISFHSLEDALVKRTFRELSEGPALPRRIPVRAQDVVTPGKIIGGPVRPGAEELERNPRSRSATLRVLERRS